MDDPLAHPEFNNEGNKNTTPGSVLLLWLLSCFFYFFEKVLNTWKVIVAFRNKERYNRITLQPDWD